MHQADLNACFATCLASKRSGRASASADASKDFGTGTPKKCSDGLSLQGLFTSRYHPKPPKTEQISSPYMQPFISTE